MVESKWTRYRIYIWYSVSKCYFLLLGDLMNKHEWLAGVWLLCFFGFAGWYSWQMKIHGWRLPKDIKDTH
jgi:hypothetical protein